MTLQEYIAYAKKLGKIEYHSYGGPNTYFQCADLANDYITKVWGLEAIIGTNAKDFPERIKQGMEYVENTPDYLPEPGELAVWNENVGGGAGHIAIVTKKGTPNLFESLDQNWSITQYITPETHSYKNVRGFIRKKGGMPETELQACLRQHADLVTELDQLKPKLAELEQAKKDRDRYRSERNEARTQVDDLTGQVAELAQKLSESKSQPPEVSGWVVNGLQIKVGDKTYNYEKK